MAESIITEEGNTSANSKLRIVDVRFYEWLLNKIWPEDKVGERFEFLVVGATGVGKSTLINNILGKEVAEVGSAPQSVTDRVQHYDASICGVQVKIYDSPGLGASFNNPGKEERHLIEMKNIMRKNIALVIFCFNMIEKRMSERNIHTFETYHRRLNLNWDKVIIALTHADMVPFFRKSHPPEEVYKEKLEEWESTICCVLTKEVGISKCSFQDLRIQPVAETTDTNLPDGQDWFTTLWLIMLEILDSRPMFPFLRIYIQNMDFSGISMDEDMEELEKLINELDRPPLSDRPPSLDRPPSIHPQEPSEEESQRSPPRVRLSSFKELIRLLLSLIEKAPPTICVPDRILQWMRHYCEN